MAIVRRAVVTCVGLMLVGCSTGSTGPGASNTRMVTSTMLAPATVASTSVARSAPSSLAPASEVGPVANVDHWHAAYGIYLCDRYSDPIDGSELPDPGGIHTHADGLIHIHPFTDTAAGSKATLGVFLAFVGVHLADHELRIATPGSPVVVRRDGDRCANGKRGRVHVLRFDGPTHSDPIEVTEPESLHLEQDQVLAIVFAPDGQLIGPPPSMSELDRPADVPVQFELTPERRRMIGPEPRVAVTNTAAPEELAITDLEVGTGATVGETSNVGVKFVLGTWSTGRAVESNWADSAPLLGLALGRNSVVAGFDQGMQGMRVGGLRRIVIPPALGFGTFGSPPLIGPNETLVLYVRLVALESPRFATRGTTLPT